MVSSPWGYLLYVLPNLLVGLSYLLFLKQPMPIRLVAAAPSLLFLLLFPLGFALGLLEVGHPGLVPMAPWLLRSLWLVAAVFALRNLLRIRTGLNILQLINVAMGCLLLFVASFVVSGGG